MEPLRTRGADAIKMHGGREAGGLGSGESWIKNKRETRPDVFDPASVERAEKNLLTEVWR